MMHLPLLSRHRASGLQTQRLDSRSMRALAILLLLAQLPHVLHLPVWVTLVGSGVVLLKLLGYRLQAPGKSRLLGLALSPLAMTLLAVGSIGLLHAHYGYFLGRDPCVAFLFILVSAKFAEVRKESDATLLMCLSGFLLLTQYFYSQSIISAIVTLPAVLALGNALVVLRDPASDRGVRQNLQLIGKLLLQGAPIAILLFVVFPRLPGPLWSLPNDAQATTGLSDSMSPGSISNLSQSDAVAFRVEFDGTIPAPHQRYWRGPILSVFDGKNWTASDQLYEVRPNGHPTSESYTVTLQPHQRRWLFALDQPTSLPRSIAVNPLDARVLGRMTHDNQLVSSKPVSKTIRYQQRSSMSGVYRPLVPPSIELTQLAGNNPRTVAFASQLRANSRSDADYANALMRRFNTEPYHYTLQPTLLGSRPVDEFLFDTRNGFCEHYAAAFVVAMRAAAIPARVVTGYLGGEMNGDYMIVRQSDAHAWAEAYINGSWKRFDPTAAVAPSRVDGLAAALPNSRAVPQMARLDGSWLKSVQLRWDGLNHHWQRLIIDFNNESQSRFWQKLGFPKPELWQLTTIVLCLSAIWCLFVLGTPNPGFRGGRTLDQLWMRFEKYLARYGIARQPLESPGEFVQRAAAGTGTESELVSLIGKTLIALRFEARPAGATHHTQRSENRLHKQLRKLMFYSLLRRAS